MRHLVTIALTLWAFIPLTRADGTLTFVNTAWVQTIAPVTPHDGSGCAKGSNTVVHLSSEMVCVVESSVDVWHRARDADERGTKP